MEGRVYDHLSCRAATDGELTRPDLTVTEGAAGLQIRSLRKSYKKRPVIRDVSMDLRRGEVVALLGPNGSGKTTCFYAIAGLVIRPKAARC